MGKSKAQSYTERLGTVEGIQYDGSNKDDIRMWLDEDKEAPRLRYSAEDHELSMEVGQGEKTWCAIDKGDYVVVDSGGSYFVYTKEDFEDSYERSDDQGEDPEADRLARSQDDETLNSSPGHKNGVAGAPITPPPVP